MCFSLSKVVKAVDLRKYDQSTFLSAENATHKPWLIK